MQRIARWLGFALPLLFAVWQYGYALTLPFFTDDANHYRFLQSVESIPALWTGQTWSAYYRPVVYSIWETMVRLQGRFDPVFQHWVNVILFGFSGVLVALVMRRLLPKFACRDSAAMVMGCAFVLVPFHYQAVNLVGSLTHIAVTFAMMSALVCGLHYLRNGSRNALMLCGVFALLANFSHETGFLVAPFLIAACLLYLRISSADLNPDPSPRWRREKYVPLHYGEGMRVRLRFWKVIAFPIVISLIYVCLWLTLPRVGIEGGLKLSSNILQNVGVMMQMFVYPMAALLRPFVVGKGAPELLIGLFAISVIVGILLIVWLERRFLLLALAGIGWYAVVILPSVLVLQPDYVWSSPRLTVLASIGAIAFWVALLSAIVANKHFKQLPRLALVSMAVVFILLLNLSFLGGRRDEYKQMRDYTKELMDVVLMADVPTQGGLLINTPYYIEAALLDRTFLVQTQFTSFMTPEVDYRNYIEVNTGREVQKPVVPIGVGRILTYGAGQYVTTIPLIDGDELLTHLREERPIIVTQFNNDNFYPVWVGTPKQQLEHRDLVRYGGAITLAGFESPIIMENRLYVNLQWQADSSIPAKLFIHVVKDGTLIAQSDGYVWGNLYPFSVWNSNERQVDRRVILLLEGTTLDEIDLYVGLYDENTGERYTAIDLQTGQPLEDNRFILPQS